MERKLDDMSAQPCGCDKGANHVCEWHSGAIAADEIVPVEPAVIGALESRLPGPPRTMPVVYIAGPYRGPDNWTIECNIRRAETLSLDVWRAGAAAICPHANTRYFQYAAPDDVWLRGDLAILAKCDAILMTPDWQKSSGAREEWLFAQHRGIPAFYTLTQLSEWMAGAQSPIVTSGYEREARSRRLNGGD